tara:strand:- start:2911 stop:3666 length:756 start_codon:yes stop_codon:yes gene_type:complete
MELTDSVRKRFTELNQSIFAKVSVRHPLFLNGSYKLSPWSSDIDLYCRVPVKDLSKVLAVVKSIRPTKDMKCLKLKVGGRLVKPKILDNVNAVRALLDTAEKKWVKLNVLLWTGATLEELSVVYDVGHPPPRHEIRASIRADIEKYRAIPDIYKVIKRQRMLSHPKSPERRRLDHILNDTRAGLLYLSRVECETIQKAKPLFPKHVIKKALGHLRQNVQVVLGLSDVSMNLRTLGNVLREELNKEIISAHM